MTPRSLFNIILKVIGIFFIKNLLIELANILPALVQFTSTENDYGGFNLMTLVIVLLECIVYLLITYLILFKTNWIITKLKLDRGFNQQEFNLNFHRSIVLRIAIIVLGSLIIVDALPLLVQQLIYYIRMKKENVPNTNIDYFILHSAKLLIGIFLIAYQRTLVNLIEYKQRRNKSLPTTDEQ
jgi:hypothetical protein